MQSLLVRITTPALLIRVLIPVLIPIPNPIPVPFFLFLLS
jgi:hypothetical protein